MCVALSLLTLSMGVPPGFQLEFMYNGFTSGQQSISLACHPHDSDRVCAPAAFPQQPCTPTRGRRFS